MLEALRSQWLLCAHAGEVHLPRGLGPLARGALAARDLVSASRALSVHVGGPGPPFVAR